MNTATLSPAELSDADLLTQCLHGERNAFGQLVARYQSLVCAQAYAICGDFARSEDVAQEAFISAWRQLRDLRDYSKFKGWLCGIARHLALRAAERRQREAEVAAQAGAEAGTKSDPHDEMISREEESIVWGAMETLPEAYRTVLTLYYREGNSAFEVAKALDLTEDAVKQRLTRGRAMLKQQVAGVVENALHRSRPTAAFTLAVLALLPAVVPTSATAASLATAAKAGVPMKAALALPALASVFGMAVGIVGGWLGFKVTAEGALYEGERQARLRSGRRAVAAIVVFMLLQAGALFGYHYWGRGHSGEMPLIMFGLVAAYVGWIVREIRRSKREIVEIVGDERAAGNAQRKPSGIWEHLCIRGPAEYRSRASFLGLPLLHVLWPAPDARETRCACGWLAVGDRPVGLIAIGGLARGGLAFGGLAIGLVAIGGIGIGPMALGGCVLAVWAYGGAALGWIANGGLAVAWHLASGAYAVAHDFALGVFGMGVEVNTPSAQAAAQQSAWLQLTGQPWFAFIVPASVLVVLALFAVIATQLRRRAISIQKTRS